MAIKNGQSNEFQKLAYKSLSNYFQEHADEVIEIEILPPTIQPPDGITMQDGSSLGIPKKVLALAYVEARHLFFMKDRGTQDLLASSWALQATKIILLFDPEHLTAANYRKRTLSLLRNEHGPHVGTPYHRALRQELCFLNSILTSPLHRQSKSPTLWYHRSNIVESLRLIELNDAPQDRIAEFWHSELAAVCKSGEQHPKNYHAWQYARKLVHKIEGHGLADDVARRVKDWCCRHPSDISGWSFMLCLMPITAASLQQELVGDVINYAISLDCTQESLWIFIRTSLALSSTTFLTSYQSLQAYKKDLEETDRHPVAMERVCNAITWIDTHRQSGT